MLFRPKFLDDVDEVAGLHPIAGEERQPLQQLAPPGVLPGERLHQADSCG